MYVFSCNGLYFLYYPKEIKVEMFFIYLFLTWKWKEKFIRKINMLIKHYMSEETVKALTRIKNTFIHSIKRMFRIRHVLIYTTVLKFQV